MTLPVGVLQSPVPAFEPPLPRVARDALAQLVMGPVVKLVLRFRSAFWERLRDRRYLEAGFFHRTEAHFPTFWTLLPLRRRQPSSTFHPRSMLLRSNLT